MSKWLKRVAAAAILVAGLTAVPMTHADAQPSRLCVRLDVWVNPFTYVQECMNMPGYPTLL